MRVPPGHDLHAMAEDAALDAARATIAAKGEQQQEQRAHERYVALQKKACVVV